MADLKPLKTTVWFNPDGSKELEIQLPYDSTADTLKHIRRVNELLLCVCRDLMERAIEHDQSKLEEPEKASFDALTPKLKHLEYGSEEYKACLRDMQPAIQHHYQNNEHHPECHKEGINGMSLIDVIEMFCDWKAASERHETGNIRKSIEINKERFGISDQLCKILLNTIGHIEALETLRSVNL